MSTLDEIAKLKSLLDDGAITQEEYEAQKAKLLAEEGGAQYGPGQNSQPYGQPNYGGAYGSAHVPGTPYSSRAEDVAANKVFGILAYIGFLCFVTMFAAPKESRYARFHANQGLVLFITEVAGFIVSGIVTAAMTGVGVIYGGIAPLSTFLIFRWLFRIAMTILAVLGIVNAVNGQDKPLPVIGGIQILK